MQNEVVSSQAVIAQTNAYLDSISRKTIAQTSDEELGERLTTLRELKKKMIDMGFNQSFSALAASAKLELDASQDEHKDLAKQIEKIRNLANAKKFTLARTRVAIASHRIAQDVKKTGFNTPVLNALPMDGNYLGKLVQSKEEGIYTYKQVLDAFETNARGAPRVSVMVEYTKNNKTERTSLLLETPWNIEERIRRAYGPEAKVVSTRVRPPSNPLLRKRSVRVSLATAYAYSASNLTPHENRRESDKTQEFRKIMNERGLEATAHPAIFEEREDLAKQLLKRGLATLKPSGYEVDDQVAIELAVTQRRKREKCANTAKHMVAFDVLRYFLTFSKKDRENGLVFPSVNPSPNPEHLAILDELAYGEEALENAAELVIQKLQAEKEASISDSRALGACIVFLCTEKDFAWCEKNFKSSEASIRQIAVSTLPFVKPIPEKLEILGLSGGRGRTFGKLVHDARNKDE